MDEARREALVQRKPWCPICEAELWDELVAGDDFDVLSSAMLAVASCPAHEDLFLRRCATCGRVSDLAKCPICGTPNERRPGASVTPPGSRRCCG